VHLGERSDTWSQRTMEFAEVALEHLGAFARPLGVRVLVENLLSEPTTPEHLITILDLGHLDGIGVCLDLGHAHISVGVSEAITVLGGRIVSMHVHDNQGTKDEHLWPGDGTIDWPAVRDAIQALKSAPAAVLEIGHSLGDAASAIPDRVQKSYERIA
jgi:sugar phosphate isomerase/epimerase